MDKPVWWVGTERERRRESERERERGASVSINKETACVRTRGDEEYGEKVASGPNSSSYGPGTAISGGEIKERRERERKKKGAAAIDLLRHEGELICAASVDLPAPR